jgi:uridine phosphorylase
MNRISETDLILNEDGSVYHLNLLPGDISDTIITVGDPERVGEISKYFDKVELKKGKREFITHTGILNNKRLTVISTGIGTDNIDIVLNELDALANIDLETRVIKKDLKSLNIIRIGTSGAMQPDIPIDSLLVSNAAFGLDSLMHYYKQSNSEDENRLLTDLQSMLPAEYRLSPYIASANKSLIAQLAQGMQQGITITAPGFYAPQGREVRAASITKQLMSIMQNYRSGEQHITNLEMETAGIYGLSEALAHKAISFNVILANRVTQEFSKQPQKIMDHFIGEILKRLVD